MTSRVAATRYARALFDVALAEGQDLDQIGRELSGDRRARLGQRGAARGRSRTPAIPAARKRAVVEALLSHSPVNALLARTLLLLADRDRLALLPDFADAFRSRLMDHQQVVRAEVTTAMELPADRVVGAAAGAGDGDRTDRCSSTCASIRRSSAARSRRSAARSTTAASRRSWQRLKRKLVEADTAGI